MTKHVREGIEDLKRDRHSPESLDRFEKDKQNF